MNDIDKLAQEIIERKCACGCGQPAHGRSKYASRRCARVNDNKKRSAKTRSIRDAAIAPQSGALVYYQGCDSPDHVDKETAQYWKNHNMLKPGDRIYMDGQTITIDHYRTG
jgi:hypothetical protein